MKSEDTIELNSPEIHEIVNGIPNLFLRWGTAFLFIATLVLLLASWIIRYPDVLSAKVVITSNPAPIELTCRASGTLHLLKNENDLLNKSDIIGWINNSSNPETVLKLESKLINNDFKNLKQDGGLGELERFQSSFISAYSEWDYFNNSKVFDKQIQQLREQKLVYEKIRKSLNSQLLLSYKEMQLAAEKYKVDSILYAQKVNSLVDYKKDNAVWLQQQRSYMNSEAALNANELQIHLLTKQESDLAFQKMDKQKELEIEKSNSYRELLSQIKLWKENYLFISPIDGKLAKLGLHEENSFTEVGKSIFSVIPLTDQMIAYAELPLRNSGKVKEGQRVNIKLDNYPYEQYGIINGWVASISILPNEENYLVRLDLRNGLVTNHKQRLSFKQQLTGTTEIITEDTRLLERFLYPFRKITQYQE